MTKAICALIFTTVILLMSNTVQAQTTQVKKDYQPSVEQIKSLIKSSFDLSPVDDISSLADKVLIAGELPAGISTLTIREGLELTLTRAIAMMGGTKKTGIGLVYLIRHSADSKTENKIEIDYKNIKRGTTKDIELKNGDIVFVSRGCVNGKLLSPTPQESRILDFTSPMEPRIVY